MPKQHCAKRVYAQEDKKDWSAARILETEILEKVIIQAEAKILFTKVFSEIFPNVYALETSFESAFETAYVDALKETCAFLSYHVQERTEETVEKIAAGRKKIRQFINGEEDEENEDES